MSHLNYRKVTHTEALDILKNGEGINTLKLGRHTVYCHPERGPILVKTKCKGPKEQFSTFFSIYPHRDAP